MDLERHPTLTRLSVVVPTLNEEARLPRLLGELRTLQGVEIIVSDGGSTDGTVAIAQSGANKVVEGRSGRGGQLNRGAALATAPLLFFIHADSHFDQPACDALRAWMDDDRSRDHAAVFRFALDARGVGWRVLEWGQAWRQRIAGIAFGDQGLILPRHTFEEVGGYPDVPIMEDAALMKTLRQMMPIHTLPAPLVTSPRRYRQVGRVRGVVRNQVLLGLRALGVNPRSLAAAYGPQSGDSKSALTPASGAPEEEAPATRTLVVFAKAPQPGRVKTRLAADVGAEAAARVYRLLGAQVMSQVDSDAYAVVVCFAPAGAESEMRGWLGDHIHFRPQSPGDLGQRMDEALTWALHMGGSACVIGTDAPDVDAALVNTAFAALRDHDIVIGPAKDGGYYLLGLNSPSPGLFEGIPWSTAEVLDTTLAAAAAAGHRVHLLPMLTDIDRLEDLPTDLRAALNP